MPDHIPAPRRPLPFCYQSTGVETRFTNLLEPEARSRAVFAFHQPETFQWIQTDLKSPGSTLRGKLRLMPPLDDRNLWPAQKRAILRLEHSLADNRPRALIQMATGSGKTFTAAIPSTASSNLPVAAGSSSWWTAARWAARPSTNPAIRHARRRPQIHRTLQRPTSLRQQARPGQQGLHHHHPAPLLHAGRPEIADNDEEERSAATWADLTRLPAPIGYNPAFPIETFDFIVTDECHRSIYNLWRQVLEYFDASLIGLTATPSKQTLGFFNRNLVMDYNHTQAVEDRVNVDYDIYQIRTEITQSGSRVDAGYYVDKRPPDPCPPR